MSAPSTTPAADRGTCTHPAFFQNLCVRCGLHSSKVPKEAELDGPGGAARKEKVILSGGNAITLTEAEAQEMKGLLADGLHKQRKLALILDLDNTLIHATQVPYKPSDIPSNMFHVSLKHMTREDNYLVQRRHGLHAFLLAASELFQLSVYTHGLRKYAEGIVRNIDPDGSFFGHRVVSWSDVPGVKDQNSRRYGKKSLDNMFLDDWSRVLVMDDREDVWMTSTQHKHLLLVKPFEYHDFHAFLAEMRRKSECPLEVCVADAVRDAPAVRGAAEQSPAACGSDACGSREDGHSPSPEGYAAELQKWAADSSDLQLARCMEVLTEIHTQYYEENEKYLATGGESSTPTSAPLKPSVATILSSMKGHILSGCCIVFSCVFPQHLTPQMIETQPIWRQAVELGAVVEHTVSEHTTHLVTPQPQTSKAKACFAMKSVHVVHPDWLMNSMWNIRRAREQDFAMGELPTLPARPYVAPSPTLTVVLGGGGFPDAEVNMKKRGRDDENNVNVVSKKLSVLEGVDSPLVDVENDAELDSDIGSSNDKSSRDSGGSDDDEAWMEDMEDELNETI